MQPERFLIENKGLDRPLLPYGREFGGVLPSQPIVLNSPERPIFKEPLFLMYTIDERSFQVTDCETLNNLAKCHFDLGEPAVALTRFQQVWDRGCRTWLVLFNMAQCHDALGDLAQAERLAIDAMLLLRADPACSTYEGMAVMLGWRIGMWEKLCKPELKAIDEAVHSIALERGEGTLDASHSSYHEQEGSEVVGMLQLNQDTAEQSGLQIMHPHYSDEPSSSMGNDV